MGFEILNILNCDFITYTNPGTHLSDEPYYLILNFRKFELKLF